MILEMEYDKFFDNMIDFEHYIIKMGKMWFGTRGPRLLGNISDAVLQQVNLGVALKIYKCM